jgi:hypothetical protein
MRIRDAIDQLSEMYDLDDEIVILWWDNSCGFLDNTPITREEMAIADWAVRDDEVSQSGIWETINYAIQKYRETGEE